MRLKKERLSCPNMIKRTDHLPVSRRPGFPNLVRVELAMRLFGCMKERICMPTMPNGGRGKTIFDIVPQLEDETEIEQIHILGRRLHIVNSSDYTVNYPPKPLFNTRLRSSTSQRVPVWHCCSWVLLVRPCWVHLCTCSYCVIASVPASGIETQQYLNTSCIGGSQSCT